MKTTFRLAGLTGVLAAIIGIGIACPAWAQQEFPPPQGKGRVVVVLSGHSGPEHYTEVSGVIAKFGYDVVLYDGNAMKGSNGTAVKTAIQQAQQMPHALPGKVAVVGFSLGGGMSLFYATHLPELVTGVIAWYPMTSPIKNPSNFVAGLQVPVLMLAGEDDTYMNCCLIKMARDIGAAAAASGKPLELVTYSSTKHDFVIDGGAFNARSYYDAIHRTQDRLKQYLAQ